MPFCRGLLHILRLKNDKKNCHRWAILEYHIISFQDCLLKALMCNFQEKILKNRTRWVALMIQLDVRVKTPCARKFVGGVVNLTHQVIIPPGNPPALSAGTALSSLGSAALIGCHNNVLRGWTAHDTQMTSALQTHIRGNNLICCQSIYISDPEESTIKTPGHWAALGCTGLHQWPENVERTLPSYQPQEVRLFLYLRTGRKLV